MIGKTISHYKVLGQIGEGGMGVVYVAEDTRLFRRVAIKIPHAGRDEAHYRARFLKEARAVSNLSHRNIAAVHDLGETDDGQPYIVMELVSGQTLGDVLAGPGLSVARSVEVIREVAEALSEAHAQNIVHRDIKPSNVIINDRGEVKVLDFGLAKQLEDDGSNPDARTLLSVRTRSDVVIGTPLYLSPEQARGAKVDGRSDLFALGALLYECVAGRPAFSGANVIEIGAQVLHVDPPPPSRFNPRVPAELDRLVARALAKRPEDRFQTAEDFAAELARVRARLSSNDTMRTRRLVSAENLVRSSAFITMAEGLRRPRFSPLAALGAFAAIALAAAAVYFVTRTPVHTPAPRAVAAYEQGVEAMREGANYKASGLLKQAVELDDKYALAHARLAEAWSELDFTDRAKDEMIAATDTAAHDALAREDAFYLDAVRLTVRRMYPEAAEKYKALVDLKPGTPQRLVDLGRAYFKADDTDKAIEVFRDAAGRDSKYAAAWLGLGAALARKKNLAAANEAFDSAEKLYGASNNREGEAEAHYQRGRLLQELGYKAEANGELRQSLVVAQSTGNVYQQVQAMLQLVYVTEDIEEAQRLATGGINLAQRSGMQNLEARGWLDLGTLYYISKRYDDAEPNLKRGLDFARQYKARRLEAFGNFNLAGVYERLNRFDEAARLAEQAAEFYKANNFRRETTTTGILLARMKGRLGDYEAARAALEDLIKLNLNSGDNKVLGLLHHECGSVLARQDKFVEAIGHYREAIAIAKALPDEPLLMFGLLNISGAFWRLGRYSEAEQTLAQLSEVLSHRQPPDKDMAARAALVRAAMALSRSRFDEARSKGVEALASVPGDSASSEMSADADAVMCLADALGGTPARAKPLCDAATREADATGDPVFVSNVRLVLAEAILALGNAEAARDAALNAEAVFARSGRVESDWRALVVAGKACRRLGDEAAARQYLTRAAAQLAQLQVSLGAEAAGYLSRQDVQRLRRELDDDAVAEAR
jgi:tetratricopeptide (TPR) repeat protein